MADLIESCCRVKKPNRQVKKGRTDEKGRYNKNRPENV